MKMSLMREMEYRADFFMVVFQAVLFIFFNLLFYKAVIGNAGGIGDWSYPNMVALFGTYVIIDGIFMTFIVLGANAIEKYVRTGMLDSVLVKPIDSQFMITVQRGLIISESPSIIFGIGVLIYGLVQSHVVINLWNILGYIFFIFCSSLIFYSFALSFGCIVFFIDKAEELNEIIFSLKQFSKFPDIYTGMIKYVLMFVTPLVFASFVPAGIILNKINYWFVLYYLITTIVMLLFSRWLWKFGLSKYKSAGG